MKKGLVFNFNLIIFDYDYGQNLFLEEQSKNNSNQIQNSNFYNSYLRGKGYKTVNDLAIDSKT